MLIREHHSGASHLTFTESNSPGQKRSLALSHSKTENLGDPTNEWVELGFMTFMRYDNVQQARLYSTGCFSKRGSPVVQPLWLELGFVRPLETPEVEVRIGGQLELHRG